MAQIGVDSNTGFPRCPGCGSSMAVLPWTLDSRRRRPFDGSGESSGGEVHQFQERHRHCAEPVISEGLNGLVIMDRRGAGWSV